MAKTKRQIEGIAAAELSAVDDPTVEVRVTKRGADKIHTGTHDPVGGDLLFEQGETFVVARSIADPLEDLGYVEIGKPKKLGKPVPATTTTPPAQTLSDPAPVIDEITEEPIP